MTILVIPRRHRHPFRPIFVIAKPFRAVAIHLQTADRKRGVNGLRCRFAPRNDGSSHFRHNEEGFSPTWLSICRMPTAKAESVDCFVR